MEPDEFVTALELMNETAGHTNTAKRVARNIYVLAKLLRLMSYMLKHGDTSRCFKPPVDIDVKVEFYFKDLILNCNLQIDANSRFETPGCVTQHICVIICSYVASPYLQL